MSMARGDVRFPCLRKESWPMLWTRHAWLRRLFTGNNKNPSKPAKPRGRKVPLEVEPLERRWLLTTVSFHASSYSGTEGTTVQVQVDLNAATYQEVTVHLASVGGMGTATEGTDYTLPTAAISIPAGSVSATALVQLVADGVTEGD